MQIKIVCGKSLNTLVCVNQSRVCTNQSRVCTNQSRDCTNQSRSNSKQNIYFNNNSTEIVRYPVFRLSSIQTLPLLFYKGGWCSFFCLVSDAFFGQVSLSKVQIFYSGLERGLIARLAKNGITPEFVSMVHINLFLLSVFEIVKQQRLYI